MNREDWDDGVGPIVYDNLFVAAASSGELNRLDEGSNGRRNVNKYVEERQFVN